MNYLPQILLLLLWLPGLLATPLHHHYGSQVFSGAYRPEIRSAANDFSAAWLVTTEHLIAAEASVKRAENMAGATFAVVRYKVFIDNSYSSIMTRDYFDFFVEHLSSTTNQIPHSNLQVMNEKARKLNQTAELLKHEFFFQHKQDIRLNQTLAILVFSSLAFSVPKEIQQHSDIRISFFISTFYSLYRYYRNIAVYVSNEKDRQTVIDMKLPTWDLTVLKVPLDIKNYTTALPRESILDVIQNLKVDSKNHQKYQSFQYVYFSEGDQLLHMRHVKEIYNIIDESGGKFTMVPHRMNTFPLVQDLPSALDKVFEPGSSFRNDEVHLVIEDLYTPRGSCCEYGKFEVEKCYGWWYQCTQWGIKDITPWLKLGNHGYTFPTATEHRGRCVYSPNKRLCDLPPSCTQRTPHRTKFNITDIDASNLCGPHDVVEKLGPESAARKKLLKERNANRTILHMATEDGVENLQAAEHELQLLLTEVIRLRKRIKTSRYHLKKFSQLDAMDNSILAHAERTRD